MTNHAPAGACVAPGVVLEVRSGVAPGVTLTVGFGDGDTGGVLTVAGGDTDAVGVGCELVVRVVSLLLEVFRFPSFSSPLSNIHAPAAPRPSRRTVAMTVTITVRAVFDFGCATCPCRLLVANGCCGGTVATGIGDATVGAARG